MNLFGAVRGVPQCSYKGQFKLYATRDDNDEIQLEMKYAYYLRLKQQLIIIMKMNH